MRTAHQPYHHGNVKDSLLAVALELIDANQGELISLRKLANAVGVTPSAVYNHFADRNALMLAIKIRIYEKFNRFFEARFSGTDNPEEALLEICFAYYQFSKKHPSQYHFLFSSTLPLEWTTPEAVKVFCRSLARTRKIIFEIYQKHQISCSEETIVQTTLLIWSQLHGIVMLRNSGSIQAAVSYQEWPQSCALARDEEVEELIRLRVDLMLNGIIEGRQGGRSH